MVVSRRYYYILACMVVVLILAALAAWMLWGRREKEDRTLERIRLSGVMRVGLDPSYPPFENMDDASGQLFGYDIDLAQEIGERLEVEVEFVVVGFDGLYDALRADKFDAIVSGLPYDPLLTQDVRYTTSYFNAGQMLVVREDENGIESVDDLAHKSLAVELGSDGDLEGRQLTKRLEGLSLQPLPTPLDALWALKNGQADAALVDAISACHFIKYEGEVRLVGEPVVDGSYVIAVRYNSVALWSALNQVLQDMREDGTLDALRDKWL